MLNKIIITEFGAKEGIVSTNYIQKAVDAANELGDATVVIPKGVYVTGTINLGNASLYLEKGAILKGSSNPEDYYDNGFVHNEMIETISLLFSKENDGISITGEGVIDLNGSAFFDYEKRETPNVPGELTVEQILECTVTYSFRPTQPLFFYKCNNMKVEGVTILDAPCWTLSFHDCENLRLQNLTITSDFVIPNGDGMHFCGCRKVFIQGCNINTGDDCIALSAITDWNKPCEDFVISNCILRCNSKAIVLGYMHSVIKNICISNCIIKDSQRGICIMASTGTGLIEHILVENVKIDTRVRVGNWWGNGEPICIFALYHHNSSYLFDAPDRKWDININDVQFRNISCEAENLIGIIGENNNVQNITIDGMYYKRKMSNNSYIKGINKVDISPSEKTIEVDDEKDTYWLYTEGCKNIKIKNTNIEEFHGEKLNAIICSCENVEIS